MRVYKERQCSTSSHIFADIDSAGRPATLQKISCEAHRHSGDTYKKHKNLFGITKNSAPYQNKSRRSAPSYR